MGWIYSYRIVDHRGGPKFEVLINEQPWSEAVGYGNDLSLTLAEGAAFLSSELFVPTFAYSKGAEPPSGEIIQHVPRDGNGQTIPGRPEVAVMKVDFFNTRNGRVDQPVLWDPVRGIGEGIRVGKGRGAPDPEGGAGGLRRIADAGAGLALVSGI